MEKTARKWSGAMAAAVIAFAASAQAEPRQPIVVKVVYETDSTPSVKQLFDRAQQHATDIYDAIGVPLVWTAAPAKITGIALRVVVASDAGTETLLEATRGASENILGFALPEAGRIYIFLDRVLLTAQKGQILPEQALGRVLAHEIGHHVLPWKGHSDTGLMRAAPNFQSPKLPAFSDAEAESIRAFLVVANEQGGGGDADARIKRTRQCYSASL